MSAALAAGEKVQVSANSTNGTDGNWYDATVAGTQWLAQVILSSGNHAIYSRTVDAAGNVTFAVGSSDFGDAMGVDYTLDTLKPAAAPLQVQYASRVISVTSEFGSTVGDWSSLDVLGAPNTSTYGDINSAWTTENSEMDPAEQSIRVGYTVPVYATGVSIRETYGAGFVTKIQLFDTAGALMDTINVTDTSVGEQINTLNISFPQTTYLVGSVKVFIDTSASGYEEIDSIALLNSNADAQILPITVVDANQSGALDQGETIKIAFSEAVDVDTLIQGDVFATGVLTSADEAKLGTGYSVVAATAGTSSEFTITLGGGGGLAALIGSEAQRTLTFAKGKVIDAAGNAAQSNVVFVTPPDITPASIGSNSVATDDPLLATGVAVSEGAIITIVFTEAVEVASLTLNSFSVNNSHSLGNSTLTAINAILFRQHSFKLRRVLMVTRSSTQRRRLSMMRI